MNEEPIFSNFNIERAVLSALIFAPELLETLDPLPSPEFFYLPAHRAIYETVLELFDTDRPIDEEFIRTALLRKDQYDEMAFVEVLAASPITKVDHYIEELSELERRRRLQSLGFEIRTLINSGEDSTAVASKVESRLMEISEGEHGEGFISVENALDDAKKYIELMRERSNGLTGIDTGFSRLNAMTGGFDGGELIILAARPSMGKTSLALDMIRKTASMGNGAALLSLEMPRDQIAMRMLSAESGVPLHDIRTGRLNVSQRESLEDARSKISKMNIVIDDSPNTTIRQIRSKVKRLVSMNRHIKLVAIDYLQLIGSDMRKDRHLEVAEISRGLKLLAREANVAILALSQLNRSLENRNDKRPMLSDLRESGSIEQDADLVLFIYRDDVYRKEAEKKKAMEMREKGIDYRPSTPDREKPDAELIIGKQRNGPIGTVFLKFLKETASFIEKGFQEIEFEM